MSEESERLRAAFQEGDDLRDAGLKTPEDVARWDDLLYGPDPVWQVLDVYRPRDAEGPLPVIVSVHGGGWVYGDKERYQFYCMSLAQRGFAVVNFTYRLAPEYPYPAPLEDTNLVMAWILDHAEEYGFDLEYVFAVGDSAGAHLLGLYAAICTNPDYAAAYDFQVPAGFVPTAIALNCGIYGFDRWEDLPETMVLDFLPEHGSDWEIGMVDVTDHVTAAYPPVFLMTAAGDFLREQLPRMAARLIECAVPFTARYYGDASHPLGHVFHCDMRLEAAAVCNDEECAFFKRFCGRKHND